MANGMVGFVIPYFRIPDCQCNGIKGVNAAKLQLQKGFSELSLAAGMELIHDLLKAAGNHIFHAIYGAVYAVDDRFTLHL